MKKSREQKFLKYLLTFQFLIYLLISVALFYFFFVYPLINDFLVNGYTTITEKYNSKIFSNNFFDAVNIVFNDWKIYLNPFSNFFIRFFFAAAIFGAFYEQTIKSYNELKKIK